MSLKVPVPTPGLPRLALVVSYQSVHCIAPWCLKLDSTLNTSSSSSRSFLAFLIGPVISIHTLLYSYSSLFILFAQPGPSRRVVSRSLRLLLVEREWIVVANHVALPAIRPIIVSARKHMPSKSQCQCIGDIRRHQASPSHVLLLLELNLAAKIELELGANQLIAQVDAIRQRQIRQPIPEVPPHFGALIGVLDPADVANRLAAKRNTLDRKVVPHQMVYDSTASPGIVHKDKIDPMLQTEIED